MDVKAETVLRPPSALSTPEHQNLEAQENCISQDSRETTNGREGRKGREKKGGKQGRRGRGGKAEQCS